MEFIELKCGCRVDNEGEFILGETCKSRNCTECQALVELHPFGKKRFKVNIG